MLTLVEDTGREVLRDAIERAAARVAPSWPLDRSIAVNPHWGFVDQPVHKAAAAAGALSGTRLTAPRDWLARRFGERLFTEDHVRRAAALSGSPDDAALALAALSHPPARTVVGRLMSDVVDEGRSTARLAPWRDFVIDHVSFACAAYCGEGQAAWRPGGSDGLYAHWRSLAKVDAGPRLLMGLKGFRDEVNGLADHAIDEIHDGLVALGVPEDAYVTYLTALLMDVSGWASAFAFTRWEARLHGGDDDSIVELLAVRVAWEHILHGTADTDEVDARWSAAKTEWELLPAANERSQRADWLLQRAVELAYQDQLAETLAPAAGPAPGPTPKPAVQAVFCIDVRSEVFRRALEGVDPSVSTLGFAGFFGLPIAYHPGGGPARPQLPGLLAPALGAKDVGPAAGAALERRANSAATRKGWKRFMTAPGSIFSAVEATGAAHAAALVKSALGSGAAAVDPLRGDLARGDVPGVEPCLTDGSGETPLALEPRVDLAAGVLRGMGLTEAFAPLVVFVGHGAGTTNNPQAAGLGCGACGGQSGELNARLLAGLLNDKEVRAGLRERGIEIPDDTHFMGGLHDTVLDEVQLFGMDGVPGVRRAGALALEEAFAAAGHEARSERAPALGIERCVHDAVALKGAFERRACDWSEVRPEWGLARNAAFVIAPRARTRGKDLRGRAFLHEYDWSRDEGFGVLEAIMTAPMVVTHWINAQYGASTCDPQRFGSGDKLLHNVVGGHIGVLEGAGGDLRIGLAKQSVHDGTDWFHEPLRLTVAIEAPASAIDAILDKHEVVSHLAWNGWLHLTRIDPDTGALTQRLRSGWVPLRA